MALTPSRIHFAPPERVRKTNWLAYKYYAPPALEMDDASSSFFIR